MKPFIGVLAITTSLFTPAAFAADVTVQGRSWVNSCGYFSSVAGDYQVSYENRALPWGSTVELLFGWNEDRMDYSSGHLQDLHRDWVDQTLVLMSSAAPYAWSTIVSKILHERTEARKLVGLQFIFRVRMPDGSVFYERGNASSMGFYSVDFNGSMPSCVGGTDRPAMQNLRVITVDRF